MVPKSDSVHVALETAPASAHRPSGRLQNISTIRIESRGLARTDADDEKPLSIWNSSLYRQKSRAINHLETRVFRVDSRRLHQPSLTRALPT